MSRCQSASNIVCCSASSRLQRLMQVVERRAAAARAADLVPGFVREPLHVVGQVAGQLHDGGAQAGLGRMPDS